MELAEIKRLADNLKEKSIKLVQDRWHLKDDEIEPSAWSFFLGSLLHNELSNFGITLQDHKEMVSILQYAAPDVITACQQIFKAFLFHFMESEHIERDPVEEFIRLWRLGREDYQSRETLDEANDFFEMAVSSGDYKILFSRLCPKFREKVGIL